MLKKYEEQLELYNSKKTGDPIQYITKFDKFLF